MTLRTLVAILVCMGTAVGAGAAAAPPLPYIRQVDYVVQTLSGDTCSREVQSLFVLYVGSPETVFLDGTAARCGVTKSVCLVRPAWAGDGTAEPPGEWYVTEVDSERCFLRQCPLLDELVWRTIPLLARQAWAALSGDEGELILIAWSGVSGSLSIYFDPAVQADLPLYERKLEVLTQYLEEHKGETDLPFERVDPARPAGSFAAL